MVRKLNCMNSSTLNISAWAVGSWWFWVGYNADDSCCCSPDTTSVDKSRDCCFGKSSKHNSNDSMICYHHCAHFACFLNGSINQTLSADWSILSSKIDKMLHSSKDVDNGIIAPMTLIWKEWAKHQGLIFRLAGQWCLLSWMKTRVMIGWKTRTWFLFDVDLSKSRSRIMLLSPSLSRHQWANAIPNQVLEEVDSNKQGTSGMHK